MSVHKKGKRCLTRNDKRYFWYVGENVENPDLWGDLNELHIIAEDRSLILQLPLETIKDGKLLPEAITPAVVAEIITKGANTNGQDQNRGACHTGI